MKQPKLNTGETYVGITLHDDKLHHLILLPGSTKTGWKAAGEWAKAQGGVLPSRHDGLVLFKHARTQFEREGYWLDEQHADDPSYAWVQNFGWGYQNGNGLSWELRARAVRRVAIRGGMMHTAEEVRNAAAVIAHFPQHEMLLAYADLLEAMEEREQGHEAAAYDIRKLRERAAEKQKARKG